MGQFARSQWRAVLAAGMTAAVAASGGAHDGAAANAAVKIKVAISAKAVDAQPLKLRLLPLSSELRPGNAAPIYIRLGLDRPADEAKAIAEKTEKWLQGDLRQLPRDDVAKFLAERNYALNQLHLGARRQQCDWAYTLDDRRILWLELPDVQWMRQQIRPLAVRARLQIAQKDYDAAAESIATGIAMSRHVADGPFLINGLVGIATATAMTTRLFEFVEQPDAPNLYWTLSALPRPLVDLRRAFDTELRIPEIEIPELADLKRSRMPGEWDALWHRIHGWLNEVADATATGKAIKRDDFAAKMTELLGKEAPAARQYLKETMKMPAVAVDAMTPTQAIVLHFHHRFAELRDDGFKALYLSPEQAADFHAAAQKRLKHAPDDLATSLARHILPAVGKAQLAMIRLDRRIALLRAIEAIRMHAAEKGDLPGSLSDVQCVPIPSDPLTGRSFESRRDDAALVVTAPAGFGESDAIELRIELRR